MPETSQRYTARLCLVLRVVVAFAMATGVQFLSGCTPTILVDRDVTPEYTNDESSLLRWGADLRREMQDSKFSLRRGTPIEEEGWETVLSFIHVSDVQIRDYSIIYHGNAVSKVSDQFVGGTERLAQIDTNEEWPFVALVGGVNSLPSEEQPSFLIHTGDSIEVSTEGELLRFVSIANMLAIPWLNVVGNHDVYIFGNFTERNITISRWSPGLALLTSKERFMRMHGESMFAAPALSNFYGEHQPTSAGNSVMKGSSRHGFDINGVDAGDLSPFYSISLSTTPPIRLIVLDTTVDDPGIPSLSGRQVPGFGAAGYIREEQFSWLDRQLEESGNLGEAVLVFGHHPLTWHGALKLSGRNPKANGEQYLVDYLKGFSHVLAYFGGHTHRAGIFEHKNARLRSVDQAFAEVIAPSIHVFPLLALEIKMLRRNNELALSVLPIQGRVSESGAIQRGLNEACSGAILEDKIRAMDCWSEDNHVRRFIKLARVPQSVAALTAPQRKYDINVRIQPVINRLEDREFSFEFSDSDENCSIDRDASKTYCLDPGWRITAIGTPQVNTANCGSRVERVEQKGDNCFTVLARLIGCGTEFLGLGCKGRGWLGYTVRVRAEQPTEPLPGHEKNVTINAGDVPMLEVTYPGALPENHVDWLFNVIIKIGERGTSHTVALSNDRSSAEGFVARVEGSSLVIDFPDR